MSLEWQRRLKIAGIAIGVFVGYRYLLPVALPFLTAWVLAGWLYPISKKIENRTGIRKSFTGAVILTFLLGILGLAVYWGAKELLVQVEMAVSRFPCWMKMGEEMLDRCCLLLEDMTGIPQANSRSYLLLQASNLQEQFTSGFVPGQLTKIFSWARGVLLFFSGCVVAYISTILMLTEMDKLSRKLREYHWMRGIRRAAVRLKKTTVTYIKAQLVIMLLVAAVCAVGFWLMKNPYFLILGLALGALDALPVIGTGTFLYPAAVICLLKGNTMAAVGCVLLDLVTSLLREYLEPRLLGEKLGISPVVILACVYVGLFLFGASGVILGPLAFSTALELGREWDVWD